MFELAVLDVKEVEAEERAARLTPQKIQDEASPEGVKKWEGAIKSATAKLDKAMSISGKDVDLSSRLHSRIMMLKDEMALKREILVSFAPKSN